ncbi:MAG: hypothetical protein ACTS4X_01825, partial [Candidatus Hodgkinia cicadicola]
RQNYNCCNSNPLSIYYKLLFDNWARFADYGFNKSHAIAYGILAYITGYLKTHFPLEFYSINMQPNKVHKVFNGHLGKTYLFHSIIILEKLMSVVH